LKTVLGINDLCAYIFMSQAFINGYIAYLKLEKGLSPNSVAAYLDDIGKLLLFTENQNHGFSIEKTDKEKLRKFILWINEMGLAANSQARIMSGIRNFFTYLKEEKIIEKNPVELIDLPKIGRKLPVVLTVEEIDAIVAQIDHSTPEGNRNRCIIEVLYGCGLRVSELVGLKLSQIYFQHDYLRIIGKGNKERLVPLGSMAKKQLELYITGVRRHIPIAKGHIEYVFLNKFGKKISRVMIFWIIKDLCEKAGIKKNVSPHTFRHSFATHLVDGGADLRAVQEMLGHVSITTTEIYTHLDSSYLKSTIIQYHPRS